MARKKTMADEVYNVRRSNFWKEGGAAYTSNRDDWETPRELFEALDAVYHFTLDPCCTHANAKTPKHYTIEEDGLAQSWAGETVFCNPPYGRQIGAWIKKAANEAAVGGDSCNAHTC